MDDDTVVGDAVAWYGDDDEHRCNIAALHLCGVAIKETTGTTHIETQPIKKLHNTKHFPDTLFLEKQTKLDKSDLYPKTLFRHLNTHSFAFGLFGPCMESRLL